MGKDCHTKAKGSRTDRRIVNKATANTTPPAPQDLEQDETLEEDYSGVVNGQDGGESEEGATGAAAKGEDQTTLTHDADATGAYEGIKSVAGGEETAGSTAAEKVTTTPAPDSDATGAYEGVESIAGGEETAGTTATDNGAATAAHNADAAAASESANQVAGGEGKASGLHTHIYEGTVRGLESFDNRTNRRDKLHTRLRALKRKATKRIKSHAFDPGYPRPQDGTLLALIKGTILLNERGLDKLALHLPPDTSLPMNIESALLQLYKLLKAYDSMLDAHKNSRIIALDTRRLDRHLTLLIGKMCVATSAATMAGSEAVLHDERMTWGEPDDMYYEQHLGGDWVTIYNSEAKAANVLLKAGSLVAVADGAGKKTIGPYRHATQTSTELEALNRMLIRFTLHREHTQDEDDFTRMTYDGID